MWDYGLLLTWNFSLSLILNCQRSTELKFILVELRFHRIILAAVLVHVFIADYISSSLGAFCLFVCFWGGQVSLFWKPALCSEKQDSGSFLSHYCSTTRGPPTVPTHSSARTRAHACVCVWVCMSYMYRIYIFFCGSEPFESKLQRRFSMCFLRARTFSYIVI